jgi:hypothetical chaperone protein
MEGMQTTTDQRNAVGFDFGTTNSSVALVQGNSSVRIASFSSGGKESYSFRSILDFEQYKTPAGARRTHVFTGPSAIEHHLETEENDRLIQSLKSHLPSRTLTGTEVFGRRYKLEEMLARMIGDLRQHAEKQFASPIRSAMAGRPVHFASAETKRTTILPLRGCARPSFWPASSAWNLKWSRWPRLTPMNPRWTTTS